MGGEGGMGGVRDACVNPADLEIVLAADPNLRYEAALCGTICVGAAFDKPTFLTCTNSCIENRARGLSQTCTGCYGEYAWCVGPECNIWCVNQSQDACTIECTADSVRCPDVEDCLADLNFCTGRNSLDCRDDQ
jgi:hypothetical protein